MEVALNQSGSNKMPNNLIAEPRFFLMVPYNFCIERNAKLAKYLEKMQKQKVKEFEEAKAKAQAEFNEQDSDEEKVPLQTVELTEFYFPEVVKNFNGESRIAESFALKNFQQNRLEYDAVKGSEYSNFSWDRSFYKELLEYHAIHEFNTLKGKSFVSLN